MNKIRVNTMEFEVILTPLVNVVNKTDNNVELPKDSNVQHVKLLWAENKNDGDERKKHEPNKKR